VCFELSDQRGSHVGTPTHEGPDAESAASGLCAVRVREDCPRPRSRPAGDGG
jgi:hypothetical protein